MQSFALLYKKIVTLYFIISCFRNPVNSFAISFFTNLEFNELHEFKTALLFGYLLIESIHSTRIIRG